VVFSRSRRVRFLSMSLSRVLPAQTAYMDLHGFAGAVEAGSMGLD
jgi:hypothetical protein